MGEEELGDLRGQTEWHQLRKRKELQMDKVKRERLRLGSRKFFVGGCKLQTTLLKCPREAVQNYITCVAVPKLCPKSMPTIPPFSRSTMKLDRWRSPMPSTYWQLETEAIVRMK